MRRQIAEELQDRYGPPSDAVLNLLRFSVLKTVVEHAGVEAIDRRSGMLNIKFHEQSRVDPGKLLEIVTNNDGAQFTPAGCPASAFNRIGYSGENDRVFDEFVCVRLRHVDLGVLARRAIASNSRRESFTDAESGKASATSGSKRTTFVPDQTRSTYLPRKPFEKSYSGRISSSFVETSDWAGFSIRFPFFPSGASRAD